MQLNKKIIMISIATAISASAYSSPYGQLDLGASIPFNTELANNIDASFKPAIVFTSGIDYAFNQNYRRYDKHNDQIEGNKILPTDTIGNRQSEH